MGLDGTQSILISFEAVDHHCTLKEGNHECRELLCIDLRADFPRFDSGTDHRNDVAAPTTQRFASAPAQDGISIIGIDRRVEQRTAAGNSSTPLNKIGNQLF